MACGDNCRFAKGDLCRCECGGDNHGIGLTKTMKQKVMDDFITAPVEIQCPYCGESEINKLNAGSPLYRCADCGKLFTEEEIKEVSGL